VKKMNTMSVVSLCFLLFCSVIAHDTLQQAADNLNESISPQVASLITSGEIVCWKKTYGRGAGTVLDTCNSGEKSGLLCYPSCPSGMTGVGPVCWEDCRPGFTDDGAFCRKNAVIHSADNSACPWYDECGLTLSKGCSNCNAYPGSTNDGCTCRIDADIYAKKSEGRGVGWPMGCKSPLELNGALCYPQCGGKYYGVGPLCWAQCPSVAPVNCGAICGSSSSVCASSIIKLTEDGIELAGIILEGVLSSDYVTMVVKLTNLTMNVADMVINKMGWCNLMS